MPTGLSLGRWLLFRALPVLAGTTLLTSGCADPGPRDEARVYRHALDNRTDSADPARAGTVYANNLVLNVYDTPYAYRYLARPYALKPNLATAMPEVSADGLAYTIPLRQGVFFADDPAFEARDGKGREVIAQDVVYSIKRQLDPRTNSMGAWLWRDRIEEIEALDRYTVRVRLRQPFPQLVHTLAHGFAAVMAREAVEYYGEQIGVHPVGSGPFKLVSLDSQRAVLVRNPSYRREPVDLAAEGYRPELHGGLGLEALDGRTPPFVDQLEIWFIPEDGARWRSFSKGSEVHYARAPSDVIDQVLKSTDPLQLTPGYADTYRALLVAAPELVYQTFNFDFEELGYHPDETREARNRLLRCALIKAYDWTARNAAYYDGTATIFPGVIPPGLPEHDPAAHPPVARDVEGARALLREGGWNEANLPELEYGFNGTTTQQQFFEQFRAWAAEIGYPLNKIRPRSYGSFADFAAALRGSELMISLKSWSLDYPDAENILQVFYGPNRAPGSNDGNYANKRYDALYEQGATLPPGEQRTAIFREMNQILIDDCAVIAGLARTQLLMWHDDVIYYPDRNIVGGFSLKYVAFADDLAEGAGDVGDAH
jgi:oligopeptide transport system substrate-binding protein